MAAARARVQYRFDLPCRPAAIHTAGTLRRVSLSQIEYFVAVAEQGHVGRAAVTLRVAQPAISRQIRSLEDELGAALFVRTRRGMELSPAGGVFLEHARGILRSVRAARDAVQGRLPERDETR
jgi:DNA-binding transcriptional LysR family regulator